MKRLAYLTGFAGLLILVGLIVHQGLPDLLHALERAGWPLLLLVPAHLVPLALDAKTMLSPAAAAATASRRSVQEKLLQEATAPSPLFVLPPHPQRVVISRCAAHDKTVSSFGRNDGSLG